MDTSIVAINGLPIPCAVSIKYIKSSGGPNLTQRERERERERLVNVFSNNNIESTHLDDAAKNEVT
jgi:hypothetical protein